MVEMDYKFLLGTVRFNNNTHNENINWKKKKGIYRMCLRP